ncbi:MAG: metallophosphoesterase [Fusobacteriaceae bacterium]
MINLILKVLSILLFFGLIASYSLYKIYDNAWIFGLVPMLSITPIFLMYFSRKYGKISLEIFNGHYLFYLNYILLGVILILIVSFFMKLFSIDLIKEIAQRQKSFQICFVSILVIFGIYGSRNFNTVFFHNHETKILTGENIIALKFGFISDVHLNGRFDGRKLKKAFKKLKEENVELVVIGGDFLDNSYKTIKDDIGKIIKEYTFKHGIYLILGNHEYYGGIEENIKYIEGLGITILRDESIEIEGVTILGRDDKHNPNRKSLKTLLENIDSTKPLILVEHNPMGIKDIEDEKVDLYLAGHTHKGQLTPFNLVVDYLYLNSGGYKKINNTYTYVSSGLGTWMIPYRIGSTSEALIFQLLEKEL